MAGLPRKVTNMQGDDYGDTFFKRSRYVRGMLPAHRLDFNTKPDEFKACKGAGNRIPLPRDYVFEVDRFGSLLADRRSRRRFAREPMTLQELSTLLKYTSGISADQFDASGFNFRHVPSAGGLYPYETYVVANRVDGLAEGLYHYDVPSHALDLLAEGSLAPRTAAICLDQAIARQAAAVLAWTAVVPRSRWKYLQRCYRYIYMDLGHLGQNFYLVAEALRLAACTIGALYDDEGNSLLGIDGVDESLSYVGVVGRRAG
ncbi:MAG: SagB/ThcOx family dehydrogenase [Candidatus Lokiarchaeota archaeon]|nr:SagB/ThcOx family dehydrogenase [Candidatus Lokiarchaeota archaeon]